MNKSITSKISMHFSFYITRWFIRELNIKFSEYIFNSNLTFMHGLSSNKTKSEFSIRAYVKKRSGEKWVQPQTSGKICIMHPNINP